MHSRKGSAVFAETWPHEGLCSDHEEIGHRHLHAPLLPHRLQNDIHGIGLLHGIKETTLQTKVVRIGKVDTSISNTRARARLEIHEIVTH